MICSGIKCILVSMNWESWLGCTSKGEEPPLVHFCMQECYCQEQRTVKVLALMFQSLLPALDTFYTKQLWSQGTPCSVENKMCMNMLSCLPGHQISAYQDRFGICHCRGLPKVTGCHTSRIPFSSAWKASLFPTTGGKKNGVEQASVKCLTLPAKSICRGLLRSPCGVVTNSTLPVLAGD